MRQLQFEQRRWRGGLERLGELEWFQRFGLQLRELGRHELQRLREFERIG
jgi:hypothetical protein